MATTESTTPVFDDKLDEELGNLTQPLKRLRKEEEERRAKVRGEIELLKQREQTIRKRITKIEKFLRMLDPSMAPSNGGRPTHKAKRGGDARYKPMDRNLQGVYAAIRDGAETRTEIENATGISVETVNRAVKWLRTREVIRFAGLGGKTGKTETFRVMDQERERFDG